MDKIFGYFPEHFCVKEEFLKMVFSPSSIPLKHRWQNNSLSADFMADYFANFFGNDQDNLEDIDTKSEVKSAVSFIANELLENAMKFNDQDSTHSINIVLQLSNNKIIFVSKNNINYKTMVKFQLFIQELLNADPMELYIRKLENNAADDTVKESGLGFLTMINDYQAKIGWKFTDIQKEPAMITVTTMVQLEV